jgi:hypothetical protein
LGAWRHDKDLYITTSFVYIIVVLSSYFLPTSNIRDIFWYYLFSHRALFGVLFIYLLVLLVSDRYR